MVQKFSLKDLASASPAFAGGSKHSNAAKPLEPAATSVTSSATTVAAMPNQVRGSTLPERIMTAFQPKAAVAERARAVPPAVPVLSSQALYDVLTTTEIPPEYLRIAEGHAKKSGAPLLSVLQEMRLLSGEQTAQILSKVTACDYFSEDEVDNVSRQSIAGLTASTDLAYIPVGRTAEGTLRVAVSDVTAIPDALLQHTNKAHIVIASQATMRALYSQYFCNTAEQLDEKISQYYLLTTAREETSTRGGLTETVNNVALALLLHAYTTETLSLKLERTETMGIVWLALDGVLQIFRLLDLPLFDALRGRLSCALTDVPQAGPHPISFTNVELGTYAKTVGQADFWSEDDNSARTSCTRIFRRQKAYASRSCDRLGLSPSNLAVLTRASGQLSGLFLIIGPPESGKSTTLSAMCAKIERAGRETDQRFSSVMSVAPRNNSDTYAALIQGSNKAVLAIENLPKNTALLQEVPVLSTGQLVVATVQTSNIPMAIALLQAGERTSRLIAQTLCGILVQRLVRLLCTGCKVPRTGTTPLEDGRQITSDYQQGCGCLQCSYTGFVGRRLISQVMEVTEEIRTALASNALASSLYTLGLGASPAMENEGRDLVQRGLTSREELQRVLGQ